ncbi:GAF domain-containing protein [Salicibibacter cibarius]|uniref:GAF domain-containing protein n=1 Tax=Salicibibacter cibarius TaxID=2743000 RepID=A0A7T7CAC7_9BACI|nr:GAF domain-containing protein [Salicibibacter cibarius]QQK74762.1 GAF domain-containing protein [Salicibibacter cibarius]
MPSNKLIDLKTDLGCDFVGIALRDQNLVDITWPYAVGYTNDKYFRIKLRYGKGLAGQVMSSCSAMEINRFPDNVRGKATDYPIMLAEKLVSAFSVPILRDGKAAGVLLAGYRTAHDFHAAEKKKVEQAAVGVSKEVFEHGEQG